MGKSKEIYIQLQTMLSMEDEYFNVDMVYFNPKTIKTKNGIETPNILLKSLKTKINK